MLQFFSLQTIIYQISLSPKAYYFGLHPKTKHFQSCNSLGRFYCQQYQSVKEKADPEKKSKCLCFVTNQRPLQTPPSSRNISVCKAGNRLSTEESMRNGKPTIHIGTFYTDSPYPPPHNKQIQAIFFLLFSASEKNQHTHTHTHTMFTSFYINCLRRSKVAPGNTTSLGQSGWKTV